MINQEDDGEPLLISQRKPIFFISFQPLIYLHLISRRISQKKKTLSVEISKFLEDTFNSFGIDVKVERAEIGPSVTKYEVKPAVGVLTVFQTSLMI